ncbi:hypothetical protein BT63DRAFT_410246 [Microthyrium microscopicum]|uniref:Uncharacterized protein n=1 Tax=Microthyrium microscopicum TaxID=703497 RepID=A0A6A6UP41_9PEZI|nr:hypothetical protein BT63DRAFT_410246 [Microthyrium microscopicum]
MTEPFKAYRYEHTSYLIVAKITRPLFLNPLGQKILVNPSLNFGDLGYITVTPFGQTILVNPSLNIGDLVYITFTSGLMNVGIAGKGKLFLPGNRSLKYDDLLYLFPEGVQWATDCNLPAIDHTGMLGREKTHKDTMLKPLHQKLCLEAEHESSDGDHHPATGSPPASDTSDPTLVPAANQESPNADIDPTSSKVPSNQPSAIDQEAADLHNRLGKREYLSVEQVSKALHWKVQVDRGFHHVHISQSEVQQVWWANKHKKGDPFDMYPDSLSEKLRAAMAYGG